MRSPKLLVTCEHGGNRIPAANVPCFVGNLDVLKTHRAYDIGAAQLAKSLAGVLGAPHYTQTASRLVVDCNRSLRHPKLFSEFTASATAQDKALMLQRIYHPHRNRVENEIGRLRATGAVFHLAVHSFTPVLHGETRNADIGLLYDPGRPGEAALARRWRDLLNHALPGFRVRMNYPYRGAADGLTTYLRKRFARGYAGIELEVNQKHAGTPAWSILESGIAASVAALLHGKAGTL